MLRNGSYLKAEELVVGDSLMSSSTKVVIKITSIKYLDVDSVEVYDIEVEDNHNFALASDIFVHNCHKDALDAVCGATFTASKHADEYAFDYGESLDTFFNVNSEASNQTLQQQIVLDFENELKQIHSPLGKNSNVNNNLNKKNSGDTDTSRV